MTDIGCRVLCTADIHVGRVSSRLGGGEHNEHTCAALIDRLVDAALRLRVDVVAIAGDLVDHDNRFFEAFGPLLTGINQLARADIDVVAVSGNHDWDVLPRLAAQLPKERFHLLGADGNWEAHTLWRHGLPMLNVVGRCFTSELCRADPLAGLKVVDTSNVPTLGLLHADLDQPTSRYAPVSLSALQSHAVELWLLGHVHAPRWERGIGCAHVLYPGSPQAMDPGERGLHGHWLAEFDHRDVTLQSLALSSVRYETIRIDLSGIDQPDGFNAYLMQQVRGYLRCIEHDCACVRQCICDVVLIGRTKIYHDLPELTRSISETFELPMPGGMRVRIDDIRIDAQPAVDLHLLATQNDVVGELARLIVTLQSPGNDQVLDDMLHAASAQVNGLCSLPAYAPLTPPRYVTPDLQRVRLMLQRQSNRMLDALLAQKGCA